MLKVTTTKNNPTDTQTHCIEKCMSKVTTATTTTTTNNRTDTQTHCMEKTMLKVTTTTTKPDRYTDSLHGEVYVKSNNNNEKQPGRYTDSLNGEVYVKSNNNKKQPDRYTDSLHREVYVKNVYLLLKYSVTIVLITIFCMFTLFACF